MTVLEDSRTMPSSRREALLGAVAALVMLAVITVGLVLRGGDEDGGASVAAAATSSSAATDGAPATAAPPSAEDLPAAPAPGENSDPTGGAAELPPLLAAVAFDEEASGQDGVRAQVVSLEAINGTAQGPGNIAGPALRATVRLVNEATEPLTLDLVAVNMTHGRDATPASPLRDSSSHPFTGTLAPGATAEGVYVFTVPADDRDVVTLTVGYRAGTPFLVFTGSAG